MNPTPFKPGDQVAAYLRDSGGDTQDLSIPQQENEIRNWCESNQIILTTLYTDEALPGSSVVGRQGFLAMIDHFTKKAAEAGIVVWKYSRFAREIDDAQFYKADLRRRGYIIHSINENLPSGLDGRFFESAIDWMNARFLQDLSEDVKRGLQHNVTQHKAIGGTPPRGFKRSDPIHLGTRRNGMPHIVHRWIPDPELVPLVRKAFSMRASGCSFAEISKETRLYKSKTSWSYFFTNPIYIGIMNYGGTRIENYCEPIVDRKTWEAVQMISENALTTKNYDPGNHPRAKASDYILTGLVRCGICGSPMTGETVYSRKKDHTNRYYACTLKKRTYGKECNARWVPKDLFELTVLDEVTNHILDVSNLLKLHDGLAEQADRTIQETRTKLDQLLRSRSLTHVQIDRLTDALAEIGSSPAIFEKLKQKERQEQELLAQIQTTEQELEKLTNLPSDKQVQDLAEKLKPVFQTTDRQKLRRWLHTLIDHIDVQRETKKLTGVIYYFTPDEFMLTNRSHRWDSNP